VIAKWIEGGLWSRATVHLLCFLRTSPSAIALITDDVMAKIGPGVCEQISTSSSLFKALEIWT